MKVRLAIFLLFMLIIQIAFGQEIYYVNAKSGLNVRKKPDLKGEKIGKLPDGTQVKITFKPGISLFLKDEGKIIHGQWVKVIANISESKQINGYVFSGFLSTQKKEEDKKNDRKISFNNFTVTFEHQGIWRSGNISQKNQDTITVHVELGETPENQIFHIQHTYKKVEVFQRIENSVTITDEGPHCDLINWKHYNSEWYPLSFDAANHSYQTLSIIEKEGRNFSPIVLEELKAEVKNTCGDRWFNLIKYKQSIEKYDAHIATSTSRVFLLLIFTDEQGIKTRKVIEFMIPMGC